MNAQPKGETAGCGILLSGQGVLGFADEVKIGHGLARINTDNNPENPRSSAYQNRSPTTSFPNAPAGPTLRGNCSQAC
jgi:hypothetical protein